MNLYRETNINANAIIERIKTMHGDNTTSVHHSMRRINEIAFDAGFSAAIDRVWDLLLRMKRETYNAEAVKHGFPTLPTDIL